MKAQKTFSDLISKSPLGPIQVHMKKSKDCAEELIIFIEAVIQDNWDKALLSRERIVVLEKEADVLKAETRDLLPKGLFLSIPRGDLLDLIGLSDDIPNTVKDISGLVLGRRMAIPKQICGAFKELVKESVGIVITAANAIDQLSEVSKLAFGSKASNKLDEIILELDSLEADNDNTEVTVRRQLFEIEKDLPPVDVMFLYDVINKLGELADRAEQVGHRITLITSK
jgi:predicted phosphate transport protein (TIGR00153 family)|tara:strand:- start:538 stop:1218 length:681 start_codon:yes stop_codon:yes gene_type:complete